MSSCSSSSGGLPDSSSASRRCRSGTLAFAFHSTLLAKTFTFFIALKRRVLESVRISSAASSHEDTEQTSEVDTLRAQRFSKHAELLLRERARSPTVPVFQGE